MALTVACARAHEPALQRWHMPCASRAQQQNIAVHRRTACRTSDCTPRRHAQNELGQQCIDSNGQRIQPRLRSWAGHTCTESGEPYSAIMSSSFALNMPSIAVCGT
jgi:hypothetical protein